MTVLICDQSESDVLRAYAIPALNCTMNLSLLFVELVYCEMHSVEEHSRTQNISDNVQMFCKLQVCNVAF